MKLYNTMTRNKDEFIPVTPGEVKMYSCGPTVYNFFHIGNARPFIIFDALRRYFEYVGYKVTFVQNFTDVDDKIIQRANTEGISPAEVAEKYIAEYFTDAKGLGIRPATVHPKATENINEIIDFVSTLIEKGFAYESNGDVYFSTEKFAQYGKLSHQPLDDLFAGARIDVSDIKRSPVDFALWKAAKPGEPYWESPWGNGRPGWHIECSAMSRRYLGKTIDIHSGGQDLIFPHHENEIAQSEAANGCEFARYWIHNGYINVDNEKMSKSKNNFFTVRDAASVYGYPLIRFFMLSAHYRSPINYSADILDQAKAGLTRITTCRDNLTFLVKNAAVAEKDSDASRIEELNSYREKYKAALDDDFNTADAIAVIFELVRDINSEKEPSAKYAQGAKAILAELCDVLGIAPEQEQSIDAEIEELIEKRQAARKAKDFKQADAIRDELKARGIVLEDTPTGVKWKKI